MKKNKGGFLIGMGLLLITAAFLLTGYNLYDDLRAQNLAEEAAAALEKSVSDQTENSSDRDMEIPDYLLNPDMEMPVKTVNGIDYIGVLNIPALELELPVISEWSYTNLRIAPCRYSGSAYADHLIIAAHNYRSFFGSLKMLPEGTGVFFTDMDGNLFSYQVVELEILPPDFTDEMESGEWNLTLFTCTVGGQNRIAVRCERIE